MIVAEDFISATANYFAIYYKTTVSYKTQYKNKTILLLDYLS